MLQINTGKLFTHGVGRTNSLRGVLYSNLRLGTGYDLVTSAGTLRETDASSGSRAIVFEIEERMEAQEIGPGVLISHTIAPFLEDFSVVATFGLRGIVSPRHSTIERLLSNKDSPRYLEAPGQFIRRYFDERIYVHSNEFETFERFVEELLALDRKSFLAAMRAIRTFVSALYRLAEDVSLAYALMVSAGESLAQNFDGHEPAWSNVNERLRLPLNGVLRNAPTDLADAVRNVVSSFEHQSIKRRYRAFALKQINGAYFREGDALIGRPITGNEIEEALGNAYDLRSRYLHNLGQLPDALTHPHAHWEVTDIERRPTLTFQGLARLTHHVISSFISNGPKIDKEPYDYTLERSGVMQVQWAPEVWIWRPLNDANEAKARFEGFIEQLVPVLCGEKNAKISDLRPILPDIEKLLPTSSEKHRPALIVLYLMFVITLPITERPERADELLKQYDPVGSPLSSEWLIAGTLFGSLDEWSIEDHAVAHDKYLAERSKPKGLHAPRIIDAAISLKLAERYRLLKQYERSKELVGLAVENSPGHPKLIALEQNFSPRASIKWEAALLPGLLARKARKKGVEPKGDAQTK
jgi:hypothetical protein